MSTDVTGDVGQRIPIHHDVQRPVVLAARDQPGVGRHVLAYGALLHARGLDAIEKGQPRLDLGQRVGMVRFLVARRVQRCLGRLFQVRQPVAGQFRQTRDGPLAHLLRQAVQVLEKAGIAAGLQDVGHSGDRQRAGRQDLRHVQRVGAGGIGDVEVARELLGQLVVEIHRDGIERPARHIHLVAGEHVPVIGHGQGIAQLDAEGQLALGGGLCQRPNQSHGPLVLQIVVEHGVGDVNPGETQPAVQDVHHRLPAQERGVQFDEGVQPPLLHQVAGNALDLVGRATVHRRKGHVVGQLRGNLDVGQARKRLPQQRLNLIDFGGCVPHAVHKARHQRALHARQVVADAHVEDRAERRILETERPAQHVDQRPGLDVLPRRLLQLELLGPLDVVALVRHVDARAGDFQLVHNLHRLELDKARAREPGADDILGQLGMRPSPRPDGSRQILTEKSIGRIRRIRLWCVK